MPGFNIVRAGRNKEGYMEGLIHNLFHNTEVIYKQGYGVWCINPEVVMDGFSYVRNSYCKMNTIKVHYMEIIIEQEHGREAAVNISDVLGRYLLEKGFQSFITIADLGEVYMIAIVINAVSYKDGSAYHDNNKQSWELYGLLCMNLNADWEVSVTDNTFFETKNRKGNYKHGKFA